MKQLLFAYSMVVLVVLGLPACKKDNLKEPTSQLTGRVVYQGQPVGVRSAGVQFELWQSGFQLFTKIPLNIRQDGTFSAMLFDGDYKLVRARGAGPWIDNTDTIAVKVQGATAVDVPVEPYFVIKSELFERTGGVVKGTFTVQAVNNSRTLELVRMYLGPNLVLDQNNNSVNAQIAASAIPNLAQPLNISVTIPAAIAGDAFIYARVAVKTTGVAELLYTIPQKIQLK